jgi:hypothetical protein
VEDYCREEQTVLDYDGFSELQFNVPNPDFDRAGVSGVVAGRQFTTPRQVRIGLRFLALKQPRSFHIHPSHAWALEIGTDAGHASD